MKKYSVLTILIFALLNNIPQAMSSDQGNPCGHLPLLERYAAAGLVQYAPEGKIVLQLVADLHFADCGAPDCYGTYINLFPEYP